MKDPLSSLKTPVLAAGTAVFFQTGLNNQTKATVVADDGTAIIEIEIVIFGRPAQMKVPAEKLSTEHGPVQRDAPRTDPEFDEQPTVDFPKLFGCVGPLEAAEDRIKIVQTPALLVRSGRIVGLDPTNLLAYEMDYAPFATKVPPGLYPTFACEIDGNIRAVMLRLRSAPVDTYRVAVPNADDFERIVDQFNADPEAPYSYECRGTGGLADAEAIEQAKERWDDLAEEVVTALYTRDKRASFASVPINAPESGSENANIVAWAAHDGSPCPSFWCLSEDGEVIGLVSDFFRNDYSELPVSYLAEA